MLSFWEGIFCANYLKLRGHWKCCRGIWCEVYYKEPRGEDHRVVRFQEEEYFDLTLESNKGRFQCELCHYRNLKKMDPVGDKEYVTLLRAIRRENLNAFWSREPGTISSTRRDSLKLSKIGLAVGLPSVLSVMDPFPVEDSLGMGLAVCMLARSPEKGRHQSTLQFESVRKMRLEFSNWWHASKFTLTTSVMARDTRKTYVTYCLS